MKGCKGLFVMQKIFKKMNITEKKGNTIIRNKFRHKYLIIM